MQTKKLFYAFSFLAIFIACLGLLGLASFMAQQKTKEIGIRKVNGAKVSEILSMLNKDFVKWVVLAFVVATPIAYYAMNKWLENVEFDREKKRNFSKRTTDMVEYNVQKLRDAGFYLKDVSEAIEDYLNICYL